MHSVPQLQHAETGVPQPELNPEWHSRVRGYWNALGKSDLSLVAQPADWMKAMVACDLLDEMYADGFSAAKLDQFNRMMRDLHTTAFDLLASRPDSAPASTDPDEQAADDAIAEVRHLFTVEGEA